MAPWAAGIRERRRTCEGCRDLHQTRSVLAAVSGDGRALREPPSFGPMQEDLRIYFERLEGVQEPCGNRASNGTLYCNATYHCAPQRGEPQGGSQGALGERLGTSGAAPGPSTLGIVPPVVSGEACRRSPRRRAAVLRQSCAVDR